MNIPYKQASELPSFFVPYPKGTKVFYRGMTSGEVLEYGALKESDSSALEVTKYLVSLNLIKVEGTDVWELTYGDWSYLQLCIGIASSLVPGFNVQGPVCKSCSEEKTKEFKEHVEYARDKDPKYLNILLPMFPGVDPDNPQIEVHKKAHISLAEIQFDCPNLNRTYPFGFQLDNGEKAIVDFVRIKHLKSLYEEKLIEFQKTLKDREILLNDEVVIKNIREFLDTPTTTFEKIKEFQKLIANVKIDETESDILRNITQNDEMRHCISIQGENTESRLNFDNISTEEDWMLTELYKEMSHALKDEVIVSCPHCGAKSKVSVNWNNLQVLPFRGNRKRLEDRIIPIEPPSSADPPPKKHGIQVGVSALKPVSGRIE